MEIRKVIIYITRDGALHTTQERARKHVNRARKAQVESARTLEKLFKAARAEPESASGSTSTERLTSRGESRPAFTEGTHKERILAAIKAGNKKTSAIKQATGIKANVLYADLAKLRSEKVITPTNRIKTTRPAARSRKARTAAPRG